ncbi:superoxide dismutase [Rhodohalobacter sulfatireducens]|uniref:Superoxide dismutase n=1 Tax=Rhodohalobacter sulfatireducens TaxID=2911366 RepID=A0ABS9KES6_9BACT|nr:superoxide dismutase [Rhodohalobacter sulfatireducens]MCG2589363.1 superoxide dismutase [Rhodohalobacter sulfatireducens]MDR9365552.1 superoxide dismutase [Balneolaceae bacterium]MDR9409228.1 superoxide dismutase [Balneolaceae bacterium]
MAYELPELPYEHDALEPSIDKRTMEIHHGKHHQGYTNKVNAALEGHPFADLPIEEVLTRIEEVPENIRQAVINNGGGYANHKLFWTVLSPDGGGEPSGELAEAISDKYGSFDKFKEKFSSTAAGQFGSGWGWLCVDDSGELKVISTANQDSPYMHGLTPILGVDVWEHAYYLHYQNRRPDYLAAIWDVIDWDQVEENYQNAK